MASELRSTSTSFEELPSISTEKVSNTHPMYIHPSDTPGSVLIPVKLTGSKNSGLWRRSMTIALQAKRKLGFVIGTCRKEQFSTELHEDWETCNAIVLSWIMNTVSASLLSGIVYSSSTHLVWEDLKEHFDKVNRVRIFQLHREIVIISQGTDLIATYFTRLRELWDEYDDLVPTPGRGGHVKEDCYWLVGHPGQSDDHKKVHDDDSKRKDYAGNPERKPYNPHYDRKSYNPHFDRKGTFAANNVMIKVRRSYVTEHGASNNPSSSTGVQTFTDEQYRQLQEMKNDKKQQHDNHTNLADSGATQHVASNLNLLENIVETKYSAYQHIHLLNENTSNITHVGAAEFINNMRVDNVLHDLYSGRVMGIGREEGSLYIVKSVKIVRSDNGTEFFNVQCQNLFDSYGIIHQSSCVYTLQQNDIVERKHRHILNIARALKFQAHIPARYWGECIEGSVYLLNRLPSEVLQGQSPYVLLHHKVPSLDHLKVFGCLCYATNLVPSDKFDLRAKTVVMMGYSTTQKGYKQFDCATKTFFVSRDVFKKHMFSFSTSFTGGDTGQEGVEPYTTEDDASQEETVEDPYAAAGDTNITGDDDDEHHEIAGGNVNNEDTGENIVQEQEHEHVLHKNHSTSPRRSERAIKPPLWHEDYVTTKGREKSSYPISNYV
ncbi:uncharacterized protein LOC124896309 [Capsicum annuum]|uniref:uncharacterized protein LOC124896309 n=1 Tax=Capsicum annuum TaxID=4072 RepID=UPI001FB17048|nr:uncharacterized protein LOC124896309 [Capsicum annuum]